LIKIVQMSQYINPFTGLINYGNIRPEGMVFADTVA